MSKRTITYHIDAGNIEYRRRAGLGKRGFWEVSLNSLKEYYQFDPFSVQKKIP